MLKLEVFIYLCVVSALPSFAALSTSITPSGVGNGRAPDPTAAPTVRPELRRRANALLGGEGNVDVEDKVCGWVNADPDNAFSCVQKHATCFWDTHNKLVGCGNDESVQFVTSCIDYASATNCDSACAANPSNVVCSATAPYCRTVHFPDSFSMVPCASVATPIIVNLTVAGFDGNISELPRFHTAAANSTVQHTTKHEGVNTASIIAAAIGGAVLLCGLPFGIKMYLRKRRWKKAQRPRRLQEREMRNAWAGPETAPRDIYIRQEIPRATTGTNNFLFSQDWPGKAKTGPTTYELQHGNG